MLVTTKQLFQIIEEINNLNKKIDDMKTEQEKIKLLVSQLEIHTNLGLPER